MIKRNLIVLTLLIGSIYQSTSTATNSASTSASASSTSTDSSISQTSSQSTSALSQFSAQEFARAEIQRQLEYETALLEAEYDAQMIEMEFEIAQAALLLEYCDWFCVNSCVQWAFDVYSKAECLNDCGCYEGNYDHLLLSANTGSAGSVSTVPANSLQSLYSAYALGESQNPLGDYFATATTTQVFDSLHEEEQALLGVAEEAAQQAREFHHQAMCTPHYMEEEGVKQEQVGTLSYGAKQTMIESVLKQIFAEAADSVVSGKSSGFSTSSQTVTQDFGTMIKDVVDTEWGHVVGSVPMQTQTCGCPVQEPHSHKKDGVVILNDKEEVQATTLHVETEADNGEVETEVQEEIVVEEEVVDQKKTTTTTTSTTTVTKEVHVDQDAEVEKEVVIEEVVVEQEVVAQPELEIYEEVVVEEKASVKQQTVVKEEEEEEEVIDTKEAAVSVTKETEVVVEKEKSVIEQELAASVPKEQTAVEKEATATVQKEETVVEKETKVVSEKETEVAAETKTISHKEEEEYIKEHEEIASYPETHSHDGEKKAQVEKVSSQIQQELTMFREQLLMDISFAISNEIQTQWDHHLTEFDQRYQAEFAALEELISGEETTSEEHVHEVHVEADGSTHEVHVEEQQTSTTQEDTHVHTKQVVEEEVVAQEVTIEGEKESVDVIVDAEVKAVTSKVVVEEEKVVVEEHADHTHEVVVEEEVLKEEPVQELMVEEKKVVETEVVVDDVVVSDEKESSVTKEVDVDAHTHVEVVEEETHTHVHELAVEEETASDVTVEKAVVVEEQPSCPAAYEAYALPSVTVATDYWTVGPSTYIDEQGVQREGRSQKFVTETITTIEHPTIEAAEPQVLVTGKSSEQRNDQGQVVQITTVITEQTTNTTKGKQVVTIVETTTIDDVRPDEVVYAEPEPYSIVVEEQPAQEEIEIAVATEQQEVIEVEIPQTTQTTATTTTTATTATKEAEVATTQQATVATEPTCAADPVQVAPETASAAPQPAYIEQEQALPTVPPAPAYAIADLTIPQADFAYAEAELGYPVADPVYVESELAYTFADPTLTTTDFNSVYGIGLTQAQLDAIHYATGHPVTPEEPIYVEDVSTYRTGITEETTHVPLNEQEVVGMLTADFSATQAKTATAQPDYNLIQASKPAQPVMLTPEQQRIEQQLLLQHQEQQRMLLQIRAQQQAQKIHIPIPQVPAQQTQVQHIPVQQVPVEQEPIEQEPIEQEPIEQEPIEQEPLPYAQIPQVPQQQVPLQQVPLQQIPLQQVPLQQVPLPQVPLQQVQFQPVPLPQVPLPQVPLPQVPLPYVPLPLPQQTPVSIEEQYAQKIEKKEIAMEAAAQRAQWELDTKRARHQSLGPQQSPASQLDLLASEKAFQNLLRQQEKELLMLEQEMEFQLAPPMEKQQLQWEQNQELQAIDQEWQQQQLELNNQLNSQLNQFNNIYSTTLGTSHALGYNHIHSDPAIIQATLDQSVANRQAHLASQEALRYQEFESNMYNMAYHLNCDQHCVSACQSWYPSFEQKATCMDSCGCVGTSNIYSGLDTGAFGYTGIPADYGYGDAYLDTNLYYSFFATGESANYWNLLTLAGALLLALGAYYFAKKNQLKKEVMVGESDEEALRQPLLGL